MLDFFTKMRNGKQISKVTPIKGLGYVPADVKDRKNHLISKELGMASKTKTNNIWWLHPQGPSGINNAGTG